MIDRPDAAELVDAVREFLAEEVQPALEGRLAFHTRVAVNALGMVARDLRDAPAFEAALRDRAARLLGRDGTPRELETALAAAIRDGSLDDRAEAVAAHVRETVRAKLLVANPAYLGAADPAPGPGAGA